MSAYAKLGKRDPPAKKKVGAWLAKSSNDDSEAEEDDAEDSESVSPEAGPSGQYRGEFWGGGAADEEDEEDEGEVGQADAGKMLTAAGAKIYSGKLGPKREAIETDLRVTDTFPPAELVTDFAELILSSLPKLYDSRSLDGSLHRLSELVEREYAVANGQEKGAMLARKLVNSSLVMARAVAVPSKAVAPSAQYPQLLLSLSLFSTLARILPEQLPQLPFWQNLIEGIALGLDLVLTAPSSIKGDGARRWNGKSKAVSSLVKGALSRTRRAIRTNHQLIPAILETLLCQTPMSAGRCLPLVGVILAVALRLKPQGKGMSHKPGEKYVEAFKARILQLYLDQVVQTTSFPPTHHISACDDLWTGSLPTEEIAARLVPAAVGGLAKSPEATCEVVVHVLSMTTADPAALSLERLVPGGIAAAKSAQKTVRDAAKILIRSVLRSLRRSSSEEQADILAVVEQILALLVSGKTSNADNRICLAEMLDVELSPEVSGRILDALAPLAAKDTSEIAQAALMDTVATQLDVCLNSRPGGAISQKLIGTLVKELGSNKTVTRRLFYSRLCKALWSSSATSTGLSPDGWKLIESCLPAFEAALKSIGGTTSPVSAVSAPSMEAYAVVALALDPMQGEGAPASVAKFLSQNTVLAGLGNLKPKPSFLLSERICRKIAIDAVDPSAAREARIWALRALSAFLSRNKKAGSDESAKQSACTGIIHIAFEAPDSLSRAEAVATLVSVASAGGWPAAELLMRCIDTFVLHYQQSLNEEETLEEKSRSAGRLAYSILTQLPKAAVATSTDDQRNLEKAKDFAEHSLVLCHRPLIVQAVPDAWINFAISMAVPLDAFAVERSSSILARTSLAGSSTILSVSQAAFDAAATMAFIAPDIYIPGILQQSARELDPLALAYIDEEAVGIWHTEEGQLFVNVLVKKDLIADKNSKGYAQEKWDEEVRASIARKKAATAGTGLSKADQALTDAQAKVESALRARMKGTQTALLRGLCRIDRLLARGISRSGQHLSLMMELSLSQTSGPAALLVGQEAIRTFCALGSLCSTRLGARAPVLGMTILRGLDAVISDKVALLEPLGAQVTRVMHFISGMSLDSPLDPVTTVYCTPLLNAVVRAGGLGCVKEEKLQALEQLTLAVAIYDGLAGQLEDQTYPRLSIVKDLLALATGQASLAKEAMSALVVAGDAMKHNASKVELQAFFSGLLSLDSYVRSGCLQALQPIDLSELDWIAELSIARFDADEHNASLALSIWEENGFEMPEEACLPTLLPFLSSKAPSVRSAAACTIAAYASQYPTRTSDALQVLRNLYGEKAKILAPDFDRFGMIVAESLDRQDPWESRVAVAEAFKELSPILAKHHVLQFFEFLVLNQALGDRDSRVRQALLQAGIAFVDTHGKSVLSELVTVFESCLGQDAPPSASNDNVREAVVVLFGRLARHLPSGDARIPRVVDRLLLALETPSEVVQVAVADCLPALVRAMPRESERFLDSLFEQLTAGAKYAIRRGAAYGIAGIIKGRGLSLMTDTGLMNRLREATQDKKNYESRQGAVFVFETLTATLGRVFEPYIISIIPLLLTIFGDGNPEVREAVGDAAKVIMSKISGHCVKAVLPLLLSGLEEKQWRVKKGSIELLGAMAYCAPKQLSLSLPTIIPELTGVLTDSHAQVRAAANTSLKTFGEVLENPEIKRMQPILLKALADPTGKTSSALSVLLSTSFEHYLDSPSLALVIPIIDRGLKQRSSEIKRKSVQIVGNLSSLTESRDFIPYLEQLMPLVQVVLADPVPEARATAAKALGTLVERLGEENFPSLISRLLQTLRSDTSGVDRQGAAQGLSEVLAGLGMARMEGLLPDIITNASSPRSYVKEGFISLLVYLPATFGQRFGPHLGRIIPPILRGLADESEFVRDASMRAGKMIIANYANRAIELLLPELERGMLDSAWRIRQSSIALTGELLYKITGISGKVEIEEDDAPTQHADASRKALTDALGQQGRDRVLSHLYIVRQDAISNVRQASIHIWKALVHNTPRITREILPMLVKMIIGLLGSESGDQRETASRTLGELCRKNGDRILAEIVPMLQEAVISGDNRTREGACTAFTEIMLTASEDHIEHHEDAIIVAIRSALVDDDANVRIAAAKAFDTMQEYIGPKAIDQTIPTLLEAMGTPGASSETALMALREVMSVRASTVFPTLLPTLTSVPISAFNARALASLVTVAGNTLSKRLANVLLPLVKSSEIVEDSQTLAEIAIAIRSLLTAVEDAEGVHALEMLLLAWAKDSSATRRVQACDMLATFCEVSAMDTANYRVDWIRQLLAMYEDGNDAVVEAAWKALDALVKTVEKDRLEDLAVPLRRAIESIGVHSIKVAGFCRNKGIQSIVPVVLAGLLGGTQEQREQAAYAIGDVVRRTTEVAIKPYIIQLTGPLIRVITTGNVAVQIKNAILSTLTVLLEEVPQLVRPFHPQLTRTMIKSASDPASISIRNRAALGLGELMKHQPRVDPVIVELTGGVKAADSDVAASVAEALASVCNAAGGSIGSTALEGVLELISEAFGERPPDTYSHAIGKMIAGLSRQHAQMIIPVIKEKVLDRNKPTPLRSICILQLLQINPAIFVQAGVIDDLGDLITVYMTYDQPATSRPARESRELIRASGDLAGQPGLASLM